MINHIACDVLVVGGGPAGLAAAIAAAEAGCKQVVVVERDAHLGGILRQCIHTGFGLHTFGEELSGPEYAHRFIQRLPEFPAIRICCNTTVLKVTPERQVTCVSPKDGLCVYDAGAVILAMGCRERPRGALGIPGERCAGVFTAGSAQQLLNLQGLMPGRRVVILGSGDIGLIMARRMTFAGAKVEAVVELMPYSSGLTRNIVQCLEDFDIPLWFSHTVSRITGKNGRVCQVEVSAVDPETRRIIPGTERVIPCDTLLLSVGLIPENELTAMAGVAMDPVTAGAVVDENLQTSIPGIFACGNVLHVHDLVDFVSQESARAGAAAAEFVAAVKAPAASPLISLADGDGVRGVVPQRLNAAALATAQRLMFRPAQPLGRCAVVVRDGQRELLRVTKNMVTPGEMVSLQLPAQKQPCGERLVVSIEAAK